MSRPNKITIQMAAKLMGKSTLFVREGMKRGVLPIGEAMQLPGSTRWTYYVSPPKLASYIGSDLANVLEEAGKCDPTRIC